MKQIKNSKKNRGFGLIEVLITTVVVAVGLLSVAALQGNFMRDSGANKTRIEAKSLCETALEARRNSLERTDYNLITAGTTTDTITGVSEVFTRAITVADATNPDRKTITARCSWGAASADETVLLVSNITFDSVRTSMGLANAANGGAIVANPSTNQNSSDEIYDDTKVKLTGSDADAAAGTIISCGANCSGDTGQVLKSNGGGTAAIVYRCPNSDYGLLPFDPFYPAATTTPTTDILYYRRVNYQPAGNGFNEAIELFEPNKSSNVLDGTCTRVIRYNGGVMIPMQGMVYTKAFTKTGDPTTLQALNLFTFNATESGSYCYPKVFPNVDNAKYVCYVGGNCTDGTVETSSPAGTNITECPSFLSGATSYPTDVYKTVGAGGWRGKIGLLGIAPNDLNVCFKEEVTANYPNTGDTLDTARNYFTLRDPNSNSPPDGNVTTDDLNEGINEAYDCHDFIIINGQANPAKVGQACTEAANTLANFHSQTKKTFRKLTATTKNNYSNYVNKYIKTLNTVACTSSSTPVTRTITGSIAGATAIPTVTVVGGTCSPITATSYTCTVTTAGTSVTINGVGTGTESNKSGSSTCTLATSGATTCNVTLNPVVTIAGAITQGTGTWDANEFIPSSILSNPLCPSIKPTTTGSGANAVTTYSYSCPNLAVGTNIEFTPSAAWYSVSPTSLTAGSSNSTVDIAINKAAPTSRTIDVSLANDSSINASLVISGATCSTSSCTGVTTSATTMRVSLANVCTSNGKKYQYTGGTATTATLITATPFDVAIPAGTSPITITISGSSTKC